MEFTEAAICRLFGSCPVEFIPDFRRASAHVEFATIDLNASEKALGQPIKVWIPFPTGSTETMVMLHERGHLAIEKHHPNSVSERESKVYTAITLTNEAAAWRWALRYAKRHDIEVTPDAWQFIAWALGTYRASCPGPKGRPFNQLWNEVWRNACGRA